MPFLSTSHSLLLLTIKIACNISHMTIDAITLRCTDNAGHAYRARSGLYQIWSLYTLNSVLCRHISRSSSTFVFEYFILFFPLWPCLFVSRIYWLNKLAPYFTFTVAVAMYTRKKIPLSMWKHPCKRQVNKSGAEKSECSLCNIVCVALSQQC